MAGQNKILKPGQTLFHEGDESDGMYIVRRGSLQVYLEKGGREIPLAQIPAGSMLGEMALFDKKPRSASARAIDEAEVTHINNGDFGKILKQIPKWFVTLMASLSTRLRETNVKLQVIESKLSSKSNSLERLAKLISGLTLLYYRFGEKEVKSWCLERQIAEEQLVQLFEFPPAYVSKAIQSLVNGGLINQSQNTYKADILVVANRGMIEKFGNFVYSLRKADASLNSIPTAVIDMIDVMGILSKQSGYANFTIKYDDLVSEGSDLSFNVEQWPRYRNVFANLDPDAIELVDKGGKVSFKVSKSALPKVMKNCKILQAIDEQSQKPEAA